jgi:hypothetical protein
MLPQENTPSVRKAFFLNPALFVAFTALVIAIHSQFAALVNAYVINGDVLQSLYWMQQFRDSELFTNDLLTEYAKHYHAPWGFLLLYRALSFAIDPLTISKLLPIFLFVTTAVYVFKLVQKCTNIYAGLLCASLFMVLPIFLGSMVGGHPRAFGFPFLIMFLYYLIGREHVKACILLVLQALFYPMIFFLSALTYAFSSVTTRQYRIVLEASRTKVAYFLLAVVISLATLSAKYIFNDSTAIGKTVTRSEMLNQPEFAEGGRVPDLLDIPPFPKAVLALSRNNALAVIKQYPTFIRQINKNLLNISTVPIVIALLFFGMTAIVIVGIIKGEIAVPKEIWYLLLASAIMYKVADIVFFRLYQPNRYILYVVPFVNIFLVSMGIAYLLTQVKIQRIQTALRVATLVLVLLHGSLNQGMGLRDYSSTYYHQSGIANNKFTISKDLYDYLRSLPRDTLLAAHPYLADNIPTFAQRKVLVNSELSHPWFDTYWHTLKMRTTDFFTAYYATDGQSIREFCEKYGIEYLVVDKRHFTSAYLEEGKVYFEPFNTAIKELVRNRQDFALLRVSEGDKLFVDGEVFVVRRDALKKV